MVRRERRENPHPANLLGGHVQRVVIASMLMLSFSLGLGVDRFTGTNADATSTFTDNPEFQILEETWSLIQDDYVALDEVDQQDIYYGAAAGMVDALGDTGHSTFLDPDEAEAFNASSEGEFVGIGIQLDYSSGQPVIEYTLDGSPAMEAGLKSRDVIVEINGTKTDGMSSEQVQAILIGNEGDAVDLTISRPATGETLNFHIVRRVIELNTVSWSLLPNNVALIRISQFSTGVNNELRSAIRAAKREGVESVILDLRDNPGGLVFEAIGVASQFIPGGQPIYLYEEKGEDPRPVNTVPNGLATDINLVVLINHGSASAAEITAAAISDNDRGNLIGETTFGTGTVLTPFTLSDGSMVVLGTALWLEPDGDQIWKTGLDPDQEVGLADDAEQLRAFSDPEITLDELTASSDEQLKAAFEDVTDEDVFPDNG